MSLITSSDYRHVNYRWQPSSDASGGDVALLVYRSNQLGADQRITNTGGGNTSVKTRERDPLTGEDVEVLWVKGSGGDLRTATRENFASLCLQKVLALKERYLADPHHGVKSPIEDAMVALYPHCTFNLNARAASIDTPLHAFIPWRHIDHTHPNSVIAVAASRRSRELTAEIFGDEVAWVPWMRPGFELALSLQKLWQQNPQLTGVVLGQHGLINGADTAEECYRASLQLIERAARFIHEHDRGPATFGGSQFPPLAEAQRLDLLVHLLPWLRGQLSQCLDGAETEVPASPGGRRAIATVAADQAVFEFVNSIDAPRLAALGTSCPDHFLRTKIRPLYVPWHPHRDDLGGLQHLLSEGLARYRQDYAAYYDRCRRDDSPPLRDPNPTVILIPGVGLIAWGKDKAESRITAEFYQCAIAVMRGAEAIGEYAALPEQEAFDIEYWQLEEAKLRRMPAERAMAREIVAVIGSGSGIGRVAAHRLARLGAHLACCDREQAAAEATARQVAEVPGRQVIAVEGDMTRREQIQALFADIVLAFGGLDHVVVTAGIYVPPDPDGKIPDDQWQLTYQVNVTGPYLVADEARRIWEAQGLPATLVIATSANAVVPKSGSMAYDTSKAAANHLIRELAIRLAPLVRVNGIAPATVLTGSAMFPRSRVIASLARYEIPFQDEETTESLRDKLARFYAARTLTRRAVTAEDQAAAIEFLVGRDSCCTTGQVLAVDGGLPDAFLR